ncbi:MAG: hypothetical protein ABF586_05150 [Sporolactobacillus sp.]
MLTKSLAYAQYFLRLTFYFKLNFIMLIGVPLANILLNKSTWFVHSPTLAEAVPVMTSWLGYMVVYWYLANGSGTRLVILREENFLKMFSLVSRGIIAIVIGDFLAQTFILSLVLFIVYIALVLAFKLSLIFCLTLLLTALMICVPVYGALLLIGLLPLKMQTLQPLLMLATFLLIFLSAYQFDNSLIVSLLTLVNPGEYVRQVSLLMLHTFGLPVRGETACSPTWLAVVTAGYLCAGAVALKKIKVQPNYKL